MCLAMWRSKHPTMTIRPELTVTPYRATSRHLSASVSAASVGRGVLFLPSGAREGSVKALDD
eukprot:scaffold12761_cov112-Isochrysis_galbana.AAC.4